MMCASAIGLALFQQIALEQMLTSRDLKVRYHALLSLPERYYDSARTRRILLNMIDDPSPWINIFAVRAAANFKTDIDSVREKFIGRLAKPKGSDDDQVVGNLLQNLLYVGIKSAEHRRIVAMKLKSQKPLIRQLSIEVLGAHLLTAKNEHARKAVVRVLDNQLRTDKDIGVRVWACQALVRAKCVSEAVNAAILEGLCAGDVDYRNKAIETLAEAAVPRHVYVAGCRIALKDRDFANRAMALRIVAQRKPVPAFLPLLEQALADDVAYARYALKAILAVDKDNRRARAALRALTPLMQELSRSGDPQVRRVARDVLEMAKTAGSQELSKTESK